VLSLLLQVRDTVFMSGDLNQNFERFLFTILGACVATIGSLLHLLFTERNGHETSMKLKVHIDTKLQEREAAVNEHFGKVEGRLQLLETHVGTDSDSGLRDEVRQLTRTIDKMRIILVRMAERQDIADGLEDISA